MRNEHVQWNSSNLDTIGPEESVLISEVSLFQGFKSTQTWYLGRKKVSCLERCPYFKGATYRGVLLWVYTYTCTCIKLTYSDGSECSAICRVFNRRIHCTHHLDMVENNFTAI